VDRASSLGFRVFAIEFRVSGFEFRVNGFRGWGGVGGTFALFSA